MTKSLKMSSRTGNVIGAVDFLNTLALKAYFKYNKFLSQLEKKQAEDAMQGIKMEELSALWHKNFEV